jgi:uncharacterized protein
MLQKLTRSELKPGESLCDYCTAKCCRYFALPIDTPTTERDFDFVRWYLVHESASLFTEDETWYLLVHTQCKHLLADNRCGIYETRPQICRDYHTDECEYDENWTYERYFEVADQLTEYREALQAFKPGQAIRGPKPNSLAVIA